MDRRSFLHSVALGTLAMPPWKAPPTGSPLPHRPLGATGLEVSILGLGCAALGYGPMSVDEGAALVHAAIDAGIDYIDCASSYRDAEEKVGAVMKTRRHEVTLATKCLERSTDDAWREINRSLERLQTDRVDVLQVHAINSVSDLDRVTEKDGALLAAIRAKDEGLCRFIGITGHTRPEVLAAALDRFPFATVLCPLSSTDALVNDFAPVIGPLAKERNLGLIAMKVLAAGNMVRHPARSLRYSLSHPVSTAVVGMASVAEVRENVAAAAGFSTMTDDEMRALEQATRYAATTDVMWWKRG
ncbi:MAG: aldo/keto reductase [Bacteroidetes bacterium]|jgi:aryl-alcohol dehydrogenase-like predicted oxidoreductase|nr:aldo/keto reductase [Bacteroidota bacterium]